MKSCDAEEENDMEELIGNESPSWRFYIIDHSTVVDVCNSLPKESPLYGGGVLLAPCFLNIRLGAPSGDGRESGSRELLLDSVDADANYSYSAIVEPFTT
jgi:hypothetical protein